MIQYNKQLNKIKKALLSADKVLQRLFSTTLTVEHKQNGDPVTIADREVNEAIKKILLENNEGWLSEETVDDLSRLKKLRVWIVDPLDGTREFIQGIPEWCVSVALVEQGQPVAGGICVPVKQQFFLGSKTSDFTLNKKSVKISNHKALRGAKILASRSEVKRGEWQKFSNESFTIIPTGSVAYKLAQVAAGEADATLSLAPKNEWDIAAGAFLVELAGGNVTDLAGKPLTFNNHSTLINGIIAANPSLWEEIYNLVRSKL